MDRVRVYVLVYKGTSEEQVYLTNVKREKDAFEYLIKEKAVNIIQLLYDYYKFSHPFTALMYPPVYSSDALLFPDVFLRG